MIKDVIEALKKVILIEERLQSLSGKTEKVAVQVQDMDKRLVAMEAKFDLLMQMASGRGFAAVNERPPRRLSANGVDETTP